MPRKFNISKSSGKRILLVDDDNEYIEATKRILEKEGHYVSVQQCGTDALTDLKENYYDLLLIDYYMPGMTGEELVENIRKFNSFVQIILQTGYANEQPPRELIKRLEIQGYFNKSEGPEKLLLWVDVGLKAAYNIQLLHRSKEGLKYILNVTPDLHKIQSLEELLQGILLQITGLLGTANSFLAVIPYNKPKGPHTEGFVATIEEDSELVIQAGTGKFFERLSIDAYLDGDSIDLVHQSLSVQKICNNDKSNIIPLVVGDSRIGVVYIDQKVDNQANIELLNIFANQAAVAIHNTRLYHMATFDQLTKVFLRGVFLNSLIRELRITYRSQDPICLLMIDVDGMKKINDTIGHLAGDQALKYIGEALTFATRQTDLRGRMGGDEFAVLLLNSDRKCVENVAGRIYQYLSDKKIESDDGTSLPIKCSIGLCELDSSELEPFDPKTPVQNIYFQYMCMKMISIADQSLYEVKRAGGNRIDDTTKKLKWMPFADIKREFEGKDFEIV
jgi:diguanylate cyclase (GGDEF)-like protein